MEKKLREEEVTKAPPKHIWVETEDGSRTLFSEKFGEACHSSTGAKTETLLHYVSGCQIRERLGSHTPFSILEVGFGLGLGFLTTKEALAEFDHPWTFTSLELDRDLVEWFGESHPGVRHVGGGVYELVSGNVHLRVITGDAREVLPRFLLTSPMVFHAIYQDAFSPKRNPTLWTRQWFELLRRCSSPDVILSTYSSSSSIRKALLKAGWRIRRGQRFGPKRSSTRAFLEGDSDQEILEHLSRSPVEALTDENLSQFTS